MIIFHKNIKSLFLVVYKNQISYGGARVLSSNNLLYLIVRYYPGGGDKVTKAAKSLLPKVENTAAGAAGTGVHNPVSYSATNSPNSKGSSSVVESSKSPKAKVLTHPISGKDQSIQEKTTNSGTFQKNETKSPWSVSPWTTYPETHSDNQGVKAYNAGINLPHAPTNTVPTCTTVVPVSPPSVAAPLLIPVAPPLPDNPIKGNPVPNQTINQKEEIESKAKKMLASKHPDYKLFDPVVFAGLTDEEL